MELSAISKIRKYRVLYEGHHFIPMAMEVHSAPGPNMIVLSRSVLSLCTVDDREVIYFCPFAFIFRTMLLLFLNML